MENLENLNEAKKPQLDIPAVIRLLSKEAMYKKSELHGLGIGDDDKLRRDSIKEMSFELGFMCARKLILDYLDNNV